MTDGMPEAAARLGLIGKHPGYGDFLRAGLSDPVASGLEHWLDCVLSDLRDTAGDDWPAFWDNAQDLRFWIGRAVLGQPLAGVMRPSRDRTGRRYPMILAAEGAALPAPVVDSDQTVYEGLTRHLDAMQPGQGAGALLSGLTLEQMGDLAGEAAQATADGPTLWAHHPAGNLDALLQSAGPVDAARALLTRSYWWAPGGPGRAAVWLGCPGLPGSQALGWLLSGVASEDARHEPE